MADEFKTHRLNEAGLQKCTAIGEVFANTLAMLDAMMGSSGRERALVLTKLQEACHFAKRAVAMQPEFQSSGCADCQGAKCVCGHP